MSAHPLTDEPAHVAAARASLVAAWAKRRKWSRSDTANFLNERSESLLAVLRRRPGKWPVRSHSVGYWLRDFAPRLFNRAHERLFAAADDTGRARLLPPELL